jgi:purine nucleosidase
VTPSAEFNVYVDPEAAAIVFDAGWPVTMIGLDVTQMAAATEAVLARIGALGTPVATAVVGMLGFYRDTQMREHGHVAPHVHDPCAVARVAKPELVTCRDARVDVELKGRLTAGMTVVDFRPRSAPRFNAKVGTGLEVAPFWDLFVGALERVAAPAPT